MATPATNNSIDLNPHIQVRQTLVRNTPTREMYSGLFNPQISWKGAKNFVDSNIFSRTPKNDSSTKLFFKLLHQVVSSFGKMEFCDFDLSESEIRERLEMSLPRFLSIHSNSFSVELTKDATLLYILKNDEFSFYIDQYLDEEIGGSDEYVITVFQQKKVELNNSGDINSILSTINSF